MKVRSRFLKAAPASIQDQTRFGGAGIWSEVYTLEERGHYVEAWRDRVWVQRCVKWIQDGATQVTPILYLKGKDEPLTLPNEHQLLSLLDRPNPRDPAVQFFPTSIFWGEVVGDWYWEIIPARDGTISELYPLMAHHAQVRAEAAKLIGYKYDPLNTGNPVLFDPAHPGERPKEMEVIAGRYGNPFDDWYGMPPLRAAKDDIVSEYYAVRYDHRFFRNSARPDVILSFKQKLDVEERRKNKEAWEEFKGVDQAHRAAILSGDVDVHEIGDGPKDVEYEHGRRLYREGEIAAFGLFPILVGDLTRATYSNFKEAEPIAWRNTMIPKLGYFASWANATLVPYFPDVDRIDFDYSAIRALREDEKEVSEVGERAVRSGAMTPAQFAEKLGLEVPDDEAAHRLYLPFNLMPIGTPREEETAPPPPAEEKTLRREIVRQLAGPRAHRSLPEDVREKWLETRAKMLGAAFNNAMPPLRRFFANMEDRILEIVLPDKADSLVELEAALAAYGWEGDAEELVQLVSGIHTGVGQGGTGATGALVGVDVSFWDLDNPEVRKLVDEMANRPLGIRSASGRVKDQVLDQVRLGIQHGLDQTSIANGGTFNVGPPGARESETVTLKGVRGVFQGYKTWEGERIARTEIAHGFNRSGALVMREAGVSHVDIVDGTGCGWVSHEDPDEANGSIRALEEYETYPLAHPNCVRAGLPRL